MWKRTSPEQSTRHAAHRNTVCWKARFVALGLAMLEKTDPPEGTWHGLLLAEPWHPSIGWSPALRLSARSASSSSCMDGIFNV